MTEVRDENRDAETVEKAHPSKIGSMVDFVKNAYVIVAKWIAKNDKNVPIDMEEKEDKVDIKHPGLGIIFLFAASAISICAYFLNRKAVGAFLGDILPVKVNLWHWTIFIDLVGMTAVVLTGCVWLSGFFSKHGTKIQEEAEFEGYNPNKADLISPRTLFRSNLNLVFYVFLVIVAGLAGYRTYVLNGYNLEINILLNFVVTYLVEYILALAASVGMWLCLIPIAHLVYIWIRRNWSNVKIVVRFVLGLVSFVIMLPLLVLAEIVFGLFATPGRLMAGYGTFVRWLALGTERKVTRIKNKQTILENNNALKEVAHKNRLDNIRRKKAEKAEKEKNKKRWWPFYEKVQVGGDE